ncbi:MAG: 2,5-diamino-6-(ribosylamino)-4(3H)-pyrimidinone 5'-phosphate reductase [Candidatus Thermoplasmatota archaeon]|nr:2,5-diamino-6-(ribosylamino)-4(3H)-pyrimidinone 5'-phosphate reductase [Candidatus Thermoplasmatota archaeon]
MRPTVIVNCAMSVDGKIALPSRKQTRLSNEEDLTRVHRLRNQCDAIVVGIGTVLADDPKLTVKGKYVEEARQPLRVVLDSRFRTPPHALVMNDAAPTLIATTCYSPKRGNVEVIRCGTKRVDLRQLLRELDIRGVRKVLVEGGEAVIGEFLRSHLVDVLYVFVAPCVIGGRTAPTMAGGTGAATLDDVVRLHLEGVQRLGDGVLMEYRPSVTQHLDD